MARLPNYDPAEHTPRLTDLAMTRREMLQRTGMGMGAVSLAMLLKENFAAAAEFVPSGGGGGGMIGGNSPLAPRKPHFTAKAKHVIHIFAGGGPSHVDTFDPKPTLAKFDEKTLPGLNGLAYPSPFKFKKYGRSGLEISELFSNLGEVADELCVIRSMYTDIPAHEPASRFMHTGSLQLPKPSLGSWVVYGLGTDNRNMPGFISLGGKPEYRQAAFLPSLFQGSNVDFTTKMPLDQVLLNIRNSFTMTSADQRKQLDLARRLNILHAAKLQKEEQLEARIESFEMAFRMQTEATDAFDISKEPKEIRDLYGNTENGARMLVARRLVERGVRFVQVFAGGWDHHRDLETNLKKKAQEIDQPAAALIKDLKQRGLLKDTLVIWGGEFGRTVTRDSGGGAQPGRDHNGRGFCTWMAGGGVKGGLAYGATDEFGDRAVENKVHVHDLHATILQLLGFDHKRLTYRYNGRDFRLTDNYGVVAKDIIA
jgi:hypothetical protein